MDDLQIRLNQLEVPRPSPASTQAILAAAYATPRRQAAFLAPLRRVRAWIYVPQMRYVVMASVVALFIGVGLIGRLTQPDTPANRLTAEALPEDVLLYDVELADGDPLEGFSVGG